MPSSRLGGTSVGAGEVSAVNGADGKAVIFRELEKPRSIEQVDRRRVDEHRRLLQLSRVFRSPGLPSWLDPSMAMGEECKGDGRIPSNDRAGARKG